MMDRTVRTEHEAPARGPRGAPGPAPRRRDRRSPRGLAVALALVAAAAVAGLAAAGGCNSTARLDCQSVPADECIDTSCVQVQDDGTCEGDAIAPTGCYFQLCEDCPKGTACVQLTGRVATGDSDGCAAVVSCE